jgi:hypothetical protein
MKILKSIPRVEGVDWIQGTMKLISSCPEELYDLLVRHTYDASAYETIMEL